MKILALDIGEKRIGVARTDEAGIIAVPVGIIEVDEGLMENLGKIIHEEKPELIVLGMPRHSNGELSDFAKYIQEFGEVLRHEFGVKIDFEDEFGTTIEATRRLREVGVSGKQSRRLDDALAAEVILESYLRRVGDE